MNSGNPPVVLDWLETERQRAAVARIDRESTATPLTVDELRMTHKSQRLVRLAMIDGCVVGFMLYQATQTSREVIRLAVSREHRRQRVGALLIDWMKRQLGDRPEVREISVWVPESNLDALLFFKSQRFLHCETLHDDFLDEDLYRLHVIKVESECCDYVGEALEVCL